MKTTESHKTAAHTKPQETEMTTSKPEAPVATQPIHPNVSNESESATMTTAASANDSNDTSATTTTPVTSTGVVKDPPKLVLPTIPRGFRPENLALYRGTLPRTEELLAMPDVVDELARFPDFSATFGKIAPSRSEVEESLSAAYEWSMLHAQVATFLVYCQSQEAVAWTKVRGLIVRLRPAFALAVQADPSLGTSYPGMGRFFTARVTIAKRGLVARAANAKAKAAGEPAYKGGAGKRRQKAAEKAALLEQQNAAKEASASSAPATSAQPPVVPTNAEGSTAASPPAVATSAAPAPLPAVNAPTVGHA